MDGTTETLVRRRRGWMPVVALLVLAPWTAECSWGGFTVADYPLVIVFLGPLYGGAAVLIREFARRGGGGWPVIVLLAAAFGVVQAGLVDQSLFNAGFLDDTAYASLTPAPGTTVLGVAAEQAFTYVGNHVLLSICAPIMLVEAFAEPDGEHRPWLGRRGVAGVAVLYLLGSLMIFMDAEDGRKGFLLSPVQAVLAVTVTLALVGAALLLRSLASPPRDAGVGFVPSPVLFGLMVLGAHLGLWFVTGRILVAAQVAALAVLGTPAVIWSRRAGWTRRHVVTGWSAGLIAAAAGAFFAPAYKAAPASLALVSDVTVVVLAVVLVGGAYRSVRAGAPAS
ncbi:hypothetical protein [Actinoplanes sp. NPDC023714]|uniref:hypothetical protein n=1 Tax=Actinoplanes sp. NPDC023714 TaxID=3154322 RepID=UPI0033EBC7FB